MFNVHDIVMYGNLGVCRIADICPKKFDGKEILYYVLKPLSDEGSTIYYPVDSNRIKLRRLLSKEEIYDLIKAMPEADMDWIDNDQLRQERFTAVLKRDHTAILYV